MIEAAGGRRPPEHAFEAGFVYNTRYYRGSQLPELLDDLLCAIGSISILTVPGDIFSMAASANSTREFVVDDLFSASHYDPDILQWFLEVVSCYSLPDEVMSRDGVFERVLEVALSNPPYASPGPNRDELEEILA